MFHWLLVGGHHTERALHEYGHLWYDHVDVTLLIFIGGLEIISLLIKEKVCPLWLVNKKSKQRINIIAIIFNIINYI